MTLKRKATRNKQATGSSINDVTALVWEGFVTTGPVDGDKRDEVGKGLKHLKLMTSFMDDPLSHFSVSQNKWCDKEGSFCKERKKESKKERNKVRKRERKKERKN